LAAPSSKSSSAENGAAETSAENGAGAFSLASGVTTAAREVARRENLAEARFRRAPGPPIYVVPALRDARGPRLARVVVEGEHPRDEVLVEDDAAF